MSDYQKSKLDQSTVKKLFDYLFGKGDMDDSQYLDMRTIVKGRQMYGALVYYRILQEYFECEAGQTIANILERLNVSDTGVGRDQGVAVLMTPSLPKEIRIPVGVGPMLKTQEKKT